MLIDAQLCVVSAASPEKTGGHFAGTRGLAKSLHGLGFAMRGAAAERYEARLEATFADGAVIRQLGGQPIFHPAAPLVDFNLTLDSRC